MMRVTPSSATDMEELMSQSGQVPGAKEGVEAVADDRLDQIGGGIALPDSHTESLDRLKNLSGRKLFDLLSRSVDK